MELLASWNVAGRTAVTVEEIEADSVLTEMVENVFLAARCAENHATVEVTPATTLEAVSKRDRVSHLDLRFIVFLS